MIIIDDGVEGPDISFYQDEPRTPQKIDFHQMKYSADFVIIRAGQNYWIDRDFKSNWQRAKEARLPRGSYWFYDSRVEPEAQAEIFASCFINDIPELDLWLDLEENYHGKYTGAIYWKRFLDRLNKVIYLMNIDKGIYTAEGYIKGKIPLNLFEYFHKFPLWIANYGIDSSIKPTPDFIRVPLPWVDSNVLYWQWGTPKVGHQYGVESIEIDMNIFNGARSTFYYRYKLTPPTNEGEEMPSGPITLTAKLRDGMIANLRRGPSRGSSIIRLLTGPLTVNGYGSKIQADGYFWIEVAIVELGITGYVALTTSFENVIYNPPTQTDQIKIIKSTVTYEQNGQTFTEDLFPKE